MNGALTIQIIKATTPDSAIKLENAAYPAMGYRLKSDATSQSNQLAQYTMFWHHPNGKCYGDVGVGQRTGPTTAPTRTRRPPAPSAKAPGSDDPTDGTFGAEGGVERHRHRRLGQPGRRRPSPTRSPTAAR